MRGVLRKENSVEERVRHSLLCRDPILREPPKTLTYQVCNLDQVLRLVVIFVVCRHQAGHINRSSIFVPLQELHHLRLYHLAHFLEICFIRHSQNSRVFEYLQTLCFSREQWRPRNQFKQDAPCSPNIDRAVVVVRPQN